MSVPVNNAIAHPYEIWINGQKGTELSVLDRSVQFGDGLFETCVAKDGKILHWEFHRQRVLEGLRKLKIDLGLKALENFQSWVKETSPKGWGCFKWLISRGVSPRGYTHTPGRPATQVYCRYDYEGFNLDRWRNGVGVYLSEIPISENAYLAGLKHLNRLDSVLAKNSLTKQDDGSQDEPLLCLSSGKIVEASIGNIFWFDGNSWWTPPIDMAGVRGIIRSRLLEEGPREFSQNFGEKVLSWEVLQQSQSAFICNTLIGVWPIVIGGSLGARSILNNQERIENDFQPLRKVQKMVWDWYFGSQSLKNFPGFKTILEEVDGKT